MSRNNRCESYNCKRLYSRVCARCRKQYCINCTAEYACWGCRKFMCGPCRMQDQRGFELIKCEGCNRKRICASAECSFVCQNDACKSKVNCFQCAEGNFCRECRTFCCGKCRRGNDSIDRSIDYELKQCTAVGCVSTICANKPDCNGNVQACSKYGHREEAERYQQLAQQPPDDEWSHD